MEEKKQDRRSISLYTRISFQKAGILPARTSGHDLYSLTDAERNEAFFFSSLRPLRITYRRRSRDGRPIPAQRLARVPSLPPIPKWLELSELSMASPPLLSPTTGDRDGSKPMTDSLGLLFDSLTWIEPDRDCSRYLYFSLFAGRGSRWIEAVDF